ncbi:iron complex transport system substrate-binding protein [Sanguibacter gelidistatuariae]|uniref:Iron complex transport system substrate-binding protein n=1 Tax=Sanguibacter gelidistatuariae TaxID=1814289 RepID=A0A1G6HLN1_9MICO|nr:ABC transporter substrate-binding protein [Sanguibacter gelidistatuariae]SDB95160.1 iron complex transport system substrate-binding protein [Sanguibacter gelidistatuariae]
MALHLSKTVVGAASVLVGALFLTGCGAGAAETSDPTSSAGAPSSVSIESNLGTVEVPVNPARVVALDNTSFETLRDWGITPVAVPKGLLPGTGFEDWIADESILDIGTHREPNLELVSEADPDLILGGYRFTEVQEDLESIAQTIDIAGSDEAAGGYVASLQAQTTTLGEIFQKQDEAAALVADLDAASTDAAAATNGETVFLSVVNGGKIDNGAERIGRILEPLTLTDIFAGKDGDIHGDSGLAPETIAQANPDWMIVLDRDAGAKTEGAQPAKAIIDATEAFAETTFAKNDQIIYLDPQFYTREGIQAYIQAYEQVTAAFTAK